MKPNWIIGQPEINLARKRLADVGRKGTEKGALGAKGIWKILSTWEIWVFTFVYSCYIFSQSECACAVLFLGRRVLLIFG
jgi:hypothetical protein